MKFSLSHESEAEGCCGCLQGSDGFWLTELYEGEVMNGQRYRDCRSLVSGGVIWWEMQGSGRIEPCDPLILTVAAPFSPRGQPSPPI